MSLAQLFSQHAARAMNPVSTTPDALEAALCSLVATGHKTWPQIQITPEQFVSFLAKQLPFEASDAAALSALRAGDLYLVCGLGLGHPAALAALEADYMPEVRRTLHRVATPDSLIPDIIQGLYNHLLERQNAPPDALLIRAGYAGRGDLKGWLCACAVHHAGKLHKRERQEVALEQVPAALLPEENRSPELALLTGEMKVIFESAFREAIGALTSRERNLLRYHFLAGLGIDQIGTLYHVHRATAARWIAQARQRLANQTRKRFLRAAPNHAHSFSRILELVRSQLSLNLTSLLKRVTASDLPPAEMARDD